MGLFTPRWKNKNPGKRLAWIEKANAENKKHIDVLSLLTKSDKTPEVRKAAAQKITNTTVLAQIVLKDKDPHVSQAAMENFLSRADIKSDNIQELLENIAINAVNNQVRLSAVNNISYEKLLASLAQNDRSLISQAAMENFLSKADIKKDNIQGLLADIAANATDNRVYSSAIENINNEKWLAPLAQNAKKWEIRQKAVKKLSDVMLLGQIARSDNNANVRQTAVKKIDDEELLAALLKTETDNNVRNASFNKLTDQNLLLNIARTSDVFNTRQAAWEKLSKAGCDEALLDIITSKEASPDDAIETLNRIEKRKLIHQAMQKAHHGNVKKQAQLKLKLLDIKEGKINRPAKLNSDPSKMLELKRAVKGNNKVMVLQLLDEGTDPNATVPKDPSDVIWGDRETLILSHAVRAAEDKDDNSVLEILTAYGLNLNAPVWDNNGTTLFSINSTVRYADSKTKAKKAINIARFLMQNGLDVNRVDSYRTTPLLDMVKDLRDYGELLYKAYIEFGANPFIENMKGESPVSLEPELFKGVENNFDMSVFNKQFDGLDIFKAVEYDFTEPLQIWLNANKGTGLTAQINSTNEYGFTVLYCAKGYDVKKLLIKNGTDVNKENASNYNFSAPFTLLHYLAFSVQDDRSGLEEGFEFAKYLIQNGADLDKTTVFNPDIFPSGATALNIASCMNSWKICRLLIENGASQAGLKEHLQWIVNNYNNAGARRLLDFINGKLSVEDYILKKDFKKLVKIATTEDRETAEKAVEGIPIEEQESLIKIAEFDGRGGSEFYETKAQALRKVTNQDILIKHYNTNYFSVVNLIKDIEFLKSKCGSVSKAAERDEIKFVIEQKEKNPNYIEETIKEIQENYNEFIKSLEQ